MIQKNGDAQPPYLSNNVILKNTQFKKTCSHDYNYNIFCFQLVNPFIIYIYIFIINYSFFNLNKELIIIMFSK